MVNNTEISNKPSKKKDNNKAIIHIYICSIVFIVFLILLSFIYSCIRGLESLSPEYIRDITIDITGMIICGVLILSLAFDKPWDKQNRTLFRLIFALCLIFHFDVASSFMEGNPETVVGIKVANMILQFNQTLLIYCFWSYIRVELNLDNKEEKIINKLCKSVLLIDLLLNVLNYFFGFYFTVNEFGQYIPGKYEALSDITSLLLFVFTWYVLIRAKDHSVKEKAILLTFQIFPIIAHIISAITSEYSAVFPAYLFSIMLIYINVFSTRSAKLLEQEVLLNKQRTTLMVSQIQPHFLYNVLTTISNLCVTDPEEAEETTVLFSQYLRTNLDSLRQEAPVPFKSELGHINTYVQLEKKRFGEKLNVEMNCKDTDFLVPSLGLQPIVENSIKHGIRGKDTPGHLWISSEKVDGGYQVIIKDDGVGFDTNAPVKDDGRSHVGMVNVKSRLEQMCDAKVEVVSSPGNGCTTTIFFPEE